MVSQLTQCRISWRFSLSLHLSRIRYRNAIIRPKRLHGQIAWFSYCNAVDFRSRSHFRHSNCRDGWFAYDSLTTIRQWLRHESVSIKYFSEQLHGFFDPLADINCSFRAIIKFPKFYIVSGTFIFISSKSLTSKVLGAFMQRNVIGRISVHKVELPRASTLN